jgi:hypothetical protein
MLLMMDSGALRPYLDAVQATRAARSKVLKARATWPEPHTVEQVAAYARDYQAADLAHKDACRRLARQVEEAE